MGNVMRLCRRPKASASAEPDPENPAQQQGGGNDENGHIAEYDAGDRPDPKDFMFVKQTGQVLVKLPGSVNGQQFVIEECKDCYILILDFSAQVNVDMCENCHIFIGPCESSVFIRDTKNSKVIVAAQQLRLRDCNDLDMLVYVSAGQPSIEASDNIRLGCFRFSYFSLAAQFASANLSVWNSEWSDVHDFSKPASDGKQHWSFLPPETTYLDVLECQSLSAVPNIGLWPGEEQLPCPVPWTWGRRPFVHAETCFVGIPKAFESIANDLISKHMETLSKAGILLLRSRLAKVDRGQLSRLLGPSARTVLDHSSQGIIGFQFDGPNATAELNALLASDLPKVFVSKDSNDGDRCINEFFVNMKPAF